jgi:hypothetical protein
MELTKDVVFGTLAGLALLIVGSVVIQGWRAPHEVTTLARKAVSTAHAPEAEVAAVVSSTPSEAAPADSVAPGDTAGASVGPAETATAGAPVADTVENWR